MSNVFQKIKDFFSKPFPGLLSFFIKKDGSINPSVQEAMKDAEPISFWLRTAMDKISPIGLPNWSLFALVAATIVIYFAKGSIIFLIEIASALAVVILLFRVLQAIYKSFKK